MAFSPDQFPLNDDPLWYKRGIIYQIHVRAFFDSNGDGIGDFRGLTQKLDYIQDLGVTAIWLLPFYPSPLKDDGYDIADYMHVNPIYGNVSDFQVFLSEAHRRGIRVITELVLNHTSDQHEWFQLSRRSPPGSYWRDFYVWSDTPDKYAEARIIFKDFESSNWSYDSVAKAYYWHRFYSHQPDLNFDNPNVQDALLKVLDFWFDMGVDGFRLDAVPYLFEREGTNCEGLPETHQFLRRLRRHVDAKYKNRMLLAEANGWPEDAIAYFGRGDECHVAFHFPLMPRMYMSLAMEDRFPILDILAQTPNIPESCQWASFLRNHDELTLEMVSDEEREYMYQAYAPERRARINLGIRRRLAPLMQNDRRKIELLNGLLFTLPGIPIVYYGDEIGMGDNIYLGDRNGVRTPIQWNPDRNAGFSTANSQSLYLPVVVDSEYHFEAINIEASQKNPTSLLWWMKRLIALRKQHEALMLGDLKFLTPENRKVMTFTRTLGGETLLVVANLSRFAQFVELGLAEYQGLTPTELFGHTSFPVIGQLPYTFTLTPYAFYIFRLESPQHFASPMSLQDLPVGRIQAHWTEILSPSVSPRFERALLNYFRRIPWNQHRIYSLRSVDVVAHIPLEGPQPYFLIYLKVNYTEGESLTYSLPIGLVTASEELATLAVSDCRQAIFRLELGDGQPAGVVIEASLQANYNAILLDMIANEKSILYSGQTLRGVRATAASGADSLGSETQDLKSFLPLKDEHSNLLLSINNKYLFKHFRAVELGLNPEAELLEFLSRKGESPLVPTYLGSIQLSIRDQVFTAAILESYIEHQQDGWTYAIDSLATFYERILAQLTQSSSGLTEISENLPPAPRAPLLERLHDELPLLMNESMGLFVRDLEVIGQLTASLHQGLARSTESIDFQPEPFHLQSRRTLYQGIRALTAQAFTQLRRQMVDLDEDSQNLARQLLGCENAIYAEFHRLVESAVGGQRIRVHGDYHLKQLLRRGRDYCVVDFEGEAWRSVGYRRAKHSPLRDVAGLLRSLHYAANISLTERVIRLDDRQRLAPWAALWQSWSSQLFLKSYLEAMQDSALLPNSPEQIQQLINLYWIERCLHEISGELKLRPQWARVPISGILELIE